MAKTTKKQNILVFPCSSEIGLELFRSFSKSIHVKLFGASSFDSNHGKYRYENYIEGLPYVDTPGFIDSINKVVREHEIDFLFPAHDSVVLSFALNEKKLACKVIGSPYETSRICRSKMGTYQKFSSLLKIPALYENLEEVPAWPIFLKPDVGQGSKGTYKADSKKEAEFYLDRDKSLLIMEYLPGSEYTIDCFTDRNGKLRFVGARERLRIKSGISVNSRPVSDKIFSEIAETINKTLKFRGVWFFQLKKNDKDQMVLLEMAPRVAGTMSLYRNLGVNFALLSVFDAMDMDVEIVFNSFDLEVDRALENRFKTNLDFKHLYIDLDDCIICDEKVNTQAISLLYQCLNQGIKIHLLTRHADAELDKTLKRYRLTELFDTIDHLKTDDLKSTYIKHDDAIFIDDSFAERNEVKAKTGIAVFAIDAVECLLK